MPSPARPLLSETQARAFLEHPFVNFSAVADAFYADGRKNAYAALRRRIYGVERISDNTRRRLTALYDRFLDDTVQAYSEEE